MRTLERRLTVLEGGRASEPHFNLGILTDAELERLGELLRDKVVDGQWRADAELSEADYAIIAKIQPGASA